MIELEHTDEPLALVRYRRNNPNASWGEDGVNPVKDEIHRALDHEQDGLCVYCENNIDRDSCHLEHIKPKSRFQNLTFVYDNLAQSCNEQHHCGHFKANKEIPIEPRLGCNSIFQLMAFDGTLVPAADLAEADRNKAETTINLLGLNTPSLARQRQQFAFVLQSLNNFQELNDFSQTAPFRYTLKAQ